MAASKAHILSDSGAELVSDELVEDMVLMEPGDGCCCIMGRAPGG